MARHKEFDRDEALQKATEVFWARGYEGTSIQRLVGHMGINRQSLYDTFGDKHALYLQSLDRYCQLESQKAIELLENSASVKKAVRKLFAGVVEGALCDTQRRGCFAGNAVARFLYSSLQGLVLMSKATQDRKTLEDVVKVTLSVLD